MSTKTAPASLPKSLLQGKTSWERLSTKGVSGVDRENKRILGCIIAEQGPFKDMRGEFDRTSLQIIVGLMSQKPKGLKARFTHPDLSADGLGTYLGRYQDPRLEMITRQKEDGTGTEQALAVRADLYLAPTAFTSPTHGDLGTYVMDMAENDPSCFMNSLVLKTDQDYRIDPSGVPLADEKTGEELPPLWRPTALHSCDCVEDGDATHSFLAADGLSDEVVRRGAELLDKQFPNATREVLETRALSWLNRYLDRRFGQSTESLYLTDSNLGDTEGEDPGHTIADYQKGDRVGWAQEHLAHNMAMEKCGYIHETSTGPLGIPGTNLSMCGSKTNPVCLIREPTNQEEPDDGDEDDIPHGNTNWHLARYSQLKKLEEEQADPGEGNVTKGMEERSEDRTTMSAEDEAVLLGLQTELMAWEN